MSLPSIAPSATDRPAHVVIDTNVVMDWLVFRNPGLHALVDALESGRVHWIATAQMRHELAHVLGRGVASTYSPDLDHIDATWSRLCRMAEPPPAEALPRLRCTDRDDQKFIELALRDARWLITRDRAVLRLAKRAAAFGVTFTTPERWIPPA